MITTNATTSVLTSSLLTSVATLSSVAALTLGGCSYAPESTADGSGGSDASTVDGGTGGRDSGVGGDSGTGGEGGTGGDGGTLPTGPSILRPLMSPTLASTRAYVRWQDGVIPAGRTVAGYEICSTTGAAGTIDGASECPNSLNVTNFFAALAASAPSATYRFKVRARFDDSSHSLYSGLQTFSTDASVTGWWRLDNTTDDTSALAHTGTLQTGATFGTGYINQGILFDGIGGQMTVADTADHDFGTGDFTIGAWVFPMRDGIAEALVTKRGTTNGYELYRTVGGALAFYGANCGIAVTGGSLPISAWHRALATRIGTSVKLFVDGALVGTGICADDFSNAGSLTLGCNGPDTGCVEPFQGRLDEVLVRRAGSTVDDAINDVCADQAQAGATLATVCQ